MSIIKYNYSKENEEKKNRKFPKTIKKQFSN